MTGAERRSLRHSLRTLLRANYAYMFLSELKFAYAIYTAYFSLQGLSAATIGILLAVWSASTVVFELPSGALSDRFNRRTLLILSPLFKGACFVVWVLADGTEWLYGLGFVFWALSYSLMSDTKEAVVFEHVHAARFGRVYEKVIGRDRAFQEAGAWSGLFLGGFIAFVNMELAIWMSVVPLVIASVVALRLTDARDVQTKGHAKDRPSYFQNFVNAAREFRQRLRLRFLALYMALGVNLLWVYEEFYLLFFLAVSLPIWAFGAVGVWIGVIRIVLSLYAHRLKAIGPLGYAAPAVAGVLLVIAGIDNALWVLIPFLSFFAVMAPVEILVTASFQKSMGGESRATTTSAASVLVELISVMLLMAVGVVIDALGVLPAYQVGGCVFSFSPPGPFGRSGRDWP